MKKAFVSYEKRKRFSWRILLPILSVLIIVGFVIYGVGNVSRSATQERRKAALQSVTRATVQCYAIEGRYPPDLDYLEENYGLILDRDHYVYHYRLEGANLMPEIQVFEEN